MSTGQFADSMGHQPPETTFGVVTAEQFETESRDLGRAELFDGKVRTMSPSSFEHGRAASRLSRYLDFYVETEGLGAVVGNDVGFIVARNPDTVLCPDIAFVSEARLPSDRLFRFYVGAPDLAIGVISPEDRKKEVAVKTKRWLEAGVMAVWNVNPMNRTVATCTAEGETLLESQATLAGGAIVPGFTCLVSDIFAPPRRRR